MTLSINALAVGLNMIPELRHGPWRLSDGYAPLDGPSVFSCFHCGGGSTMGYKLAGCRVLGGVEIDPEMMKIYRHNHRPAHSYLMDVRDFLALDSYPDELMNLDILDGSPPCSSFSSAGARDRLWGEKKVFREGQASQVLDDLFFEYIKIGAKLRPKIIIAENVKGLVTGKAKGYVKEIFTAFKRAGYQAQLFLLNAAKMGVPQKRERVFFVARRRDLNLPPLSLDFDEEAIPFDSIKELNPTDYKTPSAAVLSLLKSADPSHIHLGMVLMSMGEKSKLFTTMLVWPGKVCYTLTGTSSSSIVIMPDKRYISRQEILDVQTFPRDYDLSALKNGATSNGAGYVCGMSVPPYMMQRLATELRKQWLG